MEWVVVLKEDNADLKLLTKHFNSTDLNIVKENNQFVIRSNYLNFKKIKSDSECIKMAEKLLKNNEYDIYEGRYLFAVIECVEPGIYRYPRIEVWYRWDNQNEEYRKIYKPEKFKQIVGWSLG